MGNRQFEGGGWLARVNVQPRADSASVESFHVPSGCRLRLRERVASAFAYALRARLRRPKLGTRSRGLPTTARCLFPSTFLLPIPTASGRWERAAG